MKTLLPSARTVEFEAIVRAIEQFNSAGLNPFGPNVRRKFRPSMRQKIDVAGIYADALQALPDTMDGQPPLPVPQQCPVTLDELLTEP
jgi:hypothetical protein